MSPANPWLPPWARLCRSFGAEFVNEPLTQDTRALQISEGKSRLGKVASANVPSLRGTELGRGKDWSDGKRLRSTCRLAHFPASPKVLV